MRIKTTKYIDNEIFQSEILDSIEQGRLTNKAGLLILQLNYNYLHSDKVYFEKGDRDKIDEFYSRVTLYVCENYHKYSTDKGTAFSFFTKMIENQYRNHFASLAWKDELGQNIKTWVTGDNGRTLVRARQVEFNENH